MKTEVKEISKLYLNTKKPPVYGRDYMTIRIQTFRAAYFLMIIL